MIRPEHPQPAATIDTLIPRPLVHSDLSPSGDHIEILRSRHKAPFVLRYIAPGMSRTRRWECFPLDFRGSRIWCLLDGRRTVREVVETYEHQYPGDAYQLPQRVWQFLQTLEQHGFIEVVESD